MSRKWEDIRKGPPRDLKPPTPEEIERSARLDKFCEGLEDAFQWDLLEPAERYTRGEITFEEFQKIAGELRTREK